MMISRGLAGRVVGVIKDPGHGISKDGQRLIKRDPVLALIRLVFARVPFEVHLASVYATSVLFFLSVQR